MKCPACGLFHPSRYEQCVSCGARLTQDSSPSSTTPAPHPKDMRRGAAKPPVKQPVKQAATPVLEEEEILDEDDEEEDLPRARKRSGGGKIPTGAILICLTVLLAAAGGTYFFLTKAPEYELLLKEGQQQLANGQYAFAQKTLEQARMIKPTDPRILLTLARAYVGVHEVNKAWDCITAAQQQGAGVVTDTQLSSDLANYYRQRNQYERAAELLRPLSTANVPKKKAELSDLLALWGDEAFRNGQNDVAVKCWEEIRELKDGQRYSEAESRLASIYAKIANEKLAKGDDDVALDYFNKLNILAPSQQTFERTSDLYTRQGKLDLAIDQLRRAQKVGSGSIELNKKLAGLLAKRGRELLDKGDSDTGYAYLQQAQGLDTKIRVPSVALRSMSLRFDPLSGEVHASGQVWNPTGNSINYLALRAELVDTKTSRVLWRRDQHLVDEFMLPMNGHETKPFEVSGECPATDGSLEIKIYLDNNYYGSYPVKTDGARTTPSAPPTAPPVRNVDPPPVAPPPSAQQEPPPAVPQRQPDPTQQPTVSPEERTLQDLD